MNYKYGIAAYNSEKHWIMIVSNDDLVFEKMDSLTFLLMRIQSDIGGEIVNNGNNQYYISNDPCGLKYQWDPCLGISVVYPAYVNRDKVTEFLSKYMG